MLVGEWNNLECMVCFFYIASPSVPVTMLHYIVLRMDGVVWYSFDFIIVNL